MAMTICEGAIVPAIMLNHADVANSAAVPLQISPDDGHHVYRHNADCCHRIAQNGQRDEHRRHQTALALILSMIMVLLSGCDGPPKQSPIMAVDPLKVCVPDLADKMVWIPAGSFIMGQDPVYREEGPAQRLEMDGFWMDIHEVTNAQFAAFVAATGYQTLAERPPPQLAGAPAEMLQAGSAVFNIPNDTDLRWWRWEVGAQWRHPSGPDEMITGKATVPVVQVAYDDALAYAKWAGKDLPTEAQWEYAARGGQPIMAEPKDSEGRPLANIYHGVFPAKDLGDDGFVTRAPVGCFKPNGYGLYDMIGNVWEWTSSDGNRADAYEGVKTIKGGSFLCAANYCARYRPAARQFQERGLGTDHIGFRLVDNQRAAPPG